jgi:hypothetical protein
MLLYESNSAKVLWDDESESVIIRKKNNPNALEPANIEILEEVAERSGADEQNAHASAAATSFHAETLEAQSWRGILDSVEALQQN